jgi:hypothetical protein
LFAAVCGEQENGIFIEAEIFVTGALGRPSSGLTPLLVFGVPSSPARVLQGGGGSFFEPREKRLASAVIFPCYF